MLQYVYSLWKHMLFKQNLFKGNDFCRDASRNCVCNLCKPLHNYSVHIAPNKANFILLHYIHQIGEMWLHFLVGFITVEDLISNICCKSDFLFRPLSQQGHAIRGDITMGSGHHLQCQQPLLSLPDPWRDTRGSGQLQWLNVSILTFGSPLDFTDYIYISFIYVTVIIRSISRLFIDAKKILLYSQHDKSFEGFKGLVRALRKLQRNTEGTSKKCVKSLIMWNIIIF